MRCNASWRNGAWGGVFVSSPAYADGYVDGTGNNIYYGYKTDASYTEARFHIEVDYYDTLEHAQAGKDKGKDPLGKFVRVHYLSNCKQSDGTADDWRFRPMWWYGVPKGLKNVQNIVYTRVEKLTNQRGNQPFKPAGSSQFTFTNAQGYGQVSQKKYNKPEDWRGISNFYFDEQNVLASKGWKQLLGLNGGSYDNAGNTESQWGDYQKQTDGLQGIFVDWESAGQRFYDMTYVGEMTKEAWENRDTNPLRFAAGVYRFAGNWHYAVGQKHNTPKIADHLKLNYPEVTKVKDTSSLTVKEKGWVQEAIENANQSDDAANPNLFNQLLKEEGGIVINNNGSATITFKDNTKRTMPASLLVTKDETDKDKYKPTLPDAIPVVNPSALTKEDKEAVIAAFKKANPDSSEFSKHLAKTDGIKFDDKGENLVLTYKDGSTATIPVSELVFQGPKISDWAPYVVPDPIEVDDITNLKPEEITQIVNEFDTANTGITPYDEAKEKNTDKKAPVTVDSKTGDATITWADGSKTTIAAWQFLKQKPKTPTPKPPEPKPAAEKKTFTVDLPDTPKNFVPNFDPFNASSANETAKNGVKALKGTLKKLTAKDSDGKTVTITDVDFDFANGEVIFKAGNDYKDKRYPMSLLFKKGSTGTQNPTQQTPTSKTYTESDNNKNTYTYFVTKTQISEAKVSDVTAQEAVKALKQFVKDNYTGWTEQDLEHVTSNVAVGTSWKAKTGTKNLEPYNNGNGRITSISVNTSDNGLTVIGYRYADQEDDDIDASTDGPLFTISADELYAPNSGSQTPTDNTIENLRKLAKQLRDKRKQAEELPDDAITTLKATDSDIDGMNDEKALRDLIKKIADYQKPKPVEYKYNFEKLTLDHDGDLTDDDYKKIVVEQFLKKNYTTTDNTNWSTLENAYSNKTVVLSGNNANTYSLTPVASGTSGLNIYTGDRQAGGVTSVIVDSNTGDLVVRGWKAGSTSNNAEELIRIKKAELFTPKPKDQTPTPSAEDLKKLKEQAKNVIDRNPKLTEEQKTNYKNQIENATTKEQIQNILKKANEQAGKNNVKPEDIKKKEKEEKDKKENEQKEKDKEKRKEKEDQKLQNDKTKASEAIDKLNNLTPEEKKKLKEQISGDGTQANQSGASTPEEVQKILDDAKNLNEARELVKVGKLPFLSHGKGDTDADDKALNELIGSDSSKKDSKLEALETALAKKDPAASAESIKNALDAAKRQNEINEANAKNAANAKLDALLQQLTDAENGLNETQKAAVKQKVDAAKTAITNAKTTVESATKPSDIKTAVDGVDTKIDAAKEDIKKNTPQRDTSGNANDDQKALDQEKEAQKKRIQDSNLSAEDKKKAIDDINNAKKIGDPTGIADRALKAQKIKDALAAIDDFKHLNKAQKDAFKAIINGTDAGNHTNDDGTTSDDIDDALANAANTDNAMARLEDLKVIADKFATGESYTKSNDADKKKAFDDASSAAGAVLAKETGDAKGAAEVNDIYADLLKAMQALDNTVKGAGVKTDALAAEIKSDKGLKPDTTATPATKGDSLYTTASTEKKTAFDQALNEAEQALNTANEENENAKNPNKTPLTPEQEAQKQKAVDDALDKLVKARLALDGVNTKPLEQQIAKDADIKKSVEYTKASDSKKKAYDDALDAAQKIIDKLTGKAQAAAGDNLDTKEAKQRALDAALKALRDAAKALDGKDTTPVPPSDDDNTGSGSESDSGSGDSTSTSGGVNKQNLINQINTTENPGGANPGSGAAGANPSAPGAGAQGAGMGAVAPGSGAGAAGTGAAGAASAGVDNKAVNNAVENAPEVKQADAAVKQAAATLDEALAQAKRVAADPHATQAQVDAAAAKLADARKALADAQANAAKVRAAVRSRVIKGMRSRGNAGIATGANVATTGLMATMIAAIGGAFATRRMRTKHANRD